MGVTHNGSLVACGRLVSRELPRDADLPIPQNPYALCLSPQKTQLCWVFGFPTVA